MLSGASTNYNVVRIINSEVYDQIQLFLKKKQMRSGSKNTRVSYERDIIEFFNVKCKKDIEYLTVEDIQLSSDDIVEYQVYLNTEKGNVNKTVNRKITTIRQIYGQLFRKGFVSSLSPFDEADRLKEGRNHHGVLTIGEVLRMSEIVKNKKSSKEKKRLTKYYLILFAMDSCLRKTAIRNLTWDDFIIKEGTNEVEITAIDKGNEDVNKIISREFYNELLQLKSESTSNRVFELNNSTIQEMMDMLKEEMGIEKKRKIVFHSIRKSGVTFQYRISGSDILQAQKAAGHKNLTTTQIYVEPRDYGMLGVVSSKGNNIDDKLYSKVTHEELIRGIELLTKSDKLLLNMKLNEIINN